MTRKWYTPEHSQPSAPEQESFWSQEFVTCADGTINLFFAGEGDRLVLGRHKYGDPMALTNRVVVRTESGNAYILGEGIAINVRDQTAHDLFNNTEPLPDVIIGEPWRIPGFMKTSNVKSVELQYKIGGEKNPGRSNPFPLAEEYIKAAEAYLEKIGQR